MEMPAIAARSGDVARGLGGVLRPARRARCAQHRTTLVFVNTRRMAERVARHLSDRLGEEAVTAHHGSLSKEKRLDAEIAAEERPAEGARRDRVAGARHRHRPRRSRLPDRIAASHRHAAAARRAIGAHHRRHAEGTRCSRSRATISSSARRCCARSGAASSTASCRTTRRSTSSRSRSSPRSACADYAEDDLFALMRARLAVPRARARRASTRSWRWSPKASPRGAAGAARSCIATK